MKICILGYSGFLGSHLSNYLSKKFTIKKIDLRKLPQKNSDAFEKFLDDKAVVLEQKSCNTLQVVAR